MNNQFTVSSSTWDSSTFNSYNANQVYTWPNNGTIGTFQSSGNWSVPTPTPMIILCSHLLRNYAEGKFGPALVVEVDELPDDVLVLFFEAASPELVFV